MQLSKTQLIVAVLAFVTMALVLGFSMGYTYKHQQEKIQLKPKKRRLPGYALLESGIGLNADGDTIQVRPISFRKK